jgi:hypothetical protein
MIPAGVVDKAVMAPSLQSVLLKAMVHLISIRSGAILIIV